MRLAYLFDGPELNGGNKVAIEHAQALADRGHAVTLLANGARPGWIDFDLPWVNYALEALPPARWDAVVCTYWTSVPIARQLGLAPLVHFCQGYEASFSHLADQRADIEAVYDLPLPTLTVTQHLAKLVSARHGRSCRSVRPFADPRFHPRPRLGPRRRPWVAVPGIFEAEVKGVSTALTAVARLRSLGHEVRLLRVSTFPPSEAEQRRLPAQTFLSGVTPAEVARALRRCDLLLFPARAEEGFGLPLLEAMASGVPVVSTDIPSAREIGAKAFRFVPEGDGEAMARAASELLSQPAAWREARRRGRVRLAHYARAAAADELEAAVRWAVAAAAALPATVEVLEPVAV